MACLHQTSFFRVFGTMKMRKGKIVSSCGDGRHQGKSAFYIQQGYCTKEFTETLTSYTWPVCVQGRNLDSVLAWRRESGHKFTSLNKMLSAISN